jgi:hypothetical protein
MNYDKDVQFVFRGNRTRMWVHLCEEYDKEIGTPMESPYKGAHMYMTAKFPELLQAFTHHRILLGQALCICIFF